MEKLTFVCPCLFGLEKTVVYEAKKIGGENVKAENGSVTFEGTWRHIALANIHFRCAERVLILVGQFNAKSFEELFQGVKALHWRDFIGKKDAFPVKGWSMNSQLHSVPDCQAIIKKAVVENLKESYELPWFEETGVKYQIQFGILKDNVKVMIDTSGVGLHKRGYRRESTEAPIKETLAAGIVDLARIRHDSVVYDPMCGSGTLLIEAAMKAFNIAPGLNRRFAAEQFPQIDKTIWEEVRKDALNDIKKDATFKAYGFDIDKNAVELTLANAKKAGVGKKIIASEGELSNFVPKIQNGIVLTNPPYGERLLDKKQAEQIYKTLGHIGRNHRDLSWYIISPDERFEGFFGKKADKRRKLYNGMIKCQLYMYFNKGKKQ